MKTIRLILTFYRSFAFVSFAITMACAVLTYTQPISILSVLFWFKIITLALFVLYVHNYKQNEIYYYKNLGISKLTLWIPILLFDFLFYLSSQIIIAKQIHETLPGS